MDWCFKNVSSLCRMTFTTDLNPKTRWCRPSGACGNNLCNSIKKDGKRAQRDRYMPGRCRLHAVHNQTDGTNTIHNLLHRVWAEMTFDGRGWKRERLAATVSAANPAIFAVWTEDWRRWIICLAETPVSQLPSFCWSHVPANHLCKSPRLLWHWQITPPQSFWPAVEVVKFQQPRLKAF